MYMDAVGPLHQPKTARTLLSDGLQRPPTCLEDASWQCIYLNGKMPEQQSWHVALHMHSNADLTACSA